METAIKPIIDAVQQSTSIASHVEQKACPNIQRLSRISRIDENGRTNIPK
jgi:hypothetical protein